MRADPRMVKTYNSADYLANHLAEAPVLILVTRKKDGIRLGTIGGASIYPAVQNLMLAARALGYGTTLTTLHALREADVKRLIGVPDEVETVALIPLGKPRGTFSTPARTPAEKVVFWDRWSNTHARP
jgi:nitroreductase